VKRRNGKILGVAIGQKSLFLAEVGGKAGAWSVSHFAEFTYPEGVDLEKPLELGQALRQFLKTQQFSTRDTVIGLPAKRLVTRRKDVPPAPAATAANMLRLQAEGEFSTEADTLVMDYAGETSTTETSSVLVIAATRDCISQCETMAKTAGLKLHGVTATGAALGRATSRVPGGNGVVVNLTPGGSELIVQHGESPTQLRHLNMGDVASGDTLGLLAGEIRRSVAALPRNGSPLTLAIWDAGNTQGPGGTKNLLEERLSMPISTPELRTIVTTDSKDSNQYAPAVAVGLAALDADRLPVDFLDSRLAAPEPPTNRRRIAWGVTLGVAALIAIIVCWSDYTAKLNHLNSDKSYLTTMKPQIDEAKTAVARRDTVRKWAPGSPRMVACLKDITNIFPDESSIYATTVSLLAQADGSYKGQIAGKAANERDIQNLSGRMKDSNKGFSNVSNPDSRRETGRGNEDFTFSISFTYRPTE
jgi:hypothetical protein